LRCRVHGGSLIPPWQLPRHPDFWPFSVGLKEAWHPNSLLSRPPLKILIAALTTPSPMLSPGVIGASSSALSPFLIHLTFLWLRIEPHLKKDMDKTTIAPKIGPTVYIKFFSTFSPSCHSFPVFLECQASLQESSTCCLSFSWRVLSNINIRSEQSVSSSPILN